MLLHQGRNEGVGPFPLLRMLYVARELLARIDGLYVLTENKVEFPVLKFTHYAYFPRRQNPTLLHKKGGALGEGSFALKDLCFSHCWSSMRYSHFPKQRPSHSREFYSKGSCLIYEILEQSRLGMPIVTTYWGLLHAMYSLGHGFFMLTNLGKRHYINTLSQIKKTRFYKSQGRPMNTNSVWTLMPYPSKIPQKNHVQRQN